MNEIPQPIPGSDPRLLERLDALEAETRRQATVVSAAQQSHEALLRRYFDVFQRVERLERRLDGRQAADC